LSSRASPNTRHASASSGLASVCSKCDKHAAAAATAAAAAAHVAVSASLLRVQIMLHQAMLSQQHMLRLNIIRLQSANTHSSTSKGWTPANPADCSRSSLAYPDQLHHQLLQISAALTTHQQTKHAC
jgi:hypothetical protein